MPTLSTAGAALEGEKILAKGRKIVPTGLPFKHSQSKKLLYPIKVTVTANAEITKTYRIVPPATTVVAKFSDSSHLAKGDTLSGNMLEGHCGKRFHPNEEKVGGNPTSKHSGQSWTMEDDCFIEITKDYLNKIVQITTTPSAPQLQS